MKRVRQIVVILGLCAVLSGTLSSLMANPVEDAAKIAECMRELQARRVASANMINSQSSINNSQLKNGWHLQAVGLWVLSVRQDVR